MGKSVYKDVDELPDLNSQEPVYKVDTKTKQVTKYNSVDELPDLKKKVGGNEPSDGGLNGTTNIPKVGLGKENVPAQNDPISLSLQAEKLRNTPRVQEPLANTSNIMKEPDLSQQPESAVELDKLVKNAGYDSKELAKEFKDFPEEAFNKEKTSREALLQLKKDNPIQYQDRLNNTKTTYQIAKNSDIHTANLFNQLNNENYGSLDEFINSKKSQLSIIDHTLTGEDRKIARDRLRQNSSKFINPNQPELIEEYNQSPFKDKIDAAQYAGLKTEEIFDPEKYKIDAAILSLPEEHSYTINLRGDIQYITKSKEEADKLGGQETQVSLDKQLGRERILKQLSDTGLQNSFEYLQNQQYNLENNYKKAKEANDQQAMDNIAQQYVQNQQSLQKIVDEGKKDADKFPLLSKLMLDEKMKEANQTTDQNVGSYFGNRFLKGFENTQDTWDDVITGLVGSDKDNALLQQQRLGENARWQNKMFLPSSLANSKNLFSKANLYKIAGFTGDIASFMTQTGLGGGGRAAELATLFNSTYSEAYNQATEEGKSSTMAHEEGLVHGGIMMLAGLFGSKYDQVKNILSKSKSPLAKEIAGVSEATWDAVVNKNKGTINNIAKSLKEVGSEQAKMIGTYGVGTTIATDLADKGLFNKEISGSEMINHAATAAKDMAIGGLLLTGAGLISKFRGNKITQMDKINLWEAADNPDITKAQIDESLRAGHITPVEANQRKKAVDELSDLITKVPQKNDKGKSLTDAERTEYLFNSVIQSKADEASKNLPPSQAEKEQQTKMVADFKNQILLKNPTDKQLETRKSQLEKALVPEKDEIGKNKEIPEQELMQIKAELEAVNSAINERTKSTETITEPVQQNVGAAKEPNIKETVSESIEPTRQGNAETTTTVLEDWSKDVESTAKALEIKNEGKAESPTKESVTERLNINNPFYKKVEDALVKLGLIEKYNPETKTGDVIGGYVQSDGRGGFASGDMYFEVDGVIKYRKDGNVVEFDRNGNVVSENTQNVKSEKAKTEIEGRKKSIQFLKDTRDSDAFKYKEETEFDKLGNRKKIKRLKTDEELKESTNKINEQIDKAEKELAELVKAVEDLLGKPKEKTTVLEEAKAKDISEAEKPPIDINFDLKDEDFVKADEPMATKKKYIDLKKEHALLKRIIKDCL